MHWLLRGFSLLRVPAVRRRVFIPLLLDAVLLVVIVLLGVWGFSGVAARFEAAVPQWLQWLSWLLWPLFIVLLIVFVALTFTTLANVLGSVFYASLSEHVQIHVTGARPPAPVKGDFLRSTWRQVRSLLYALPLALACLMLFVIPGLQPVAPPSWFAFHGWISAIQFLDFPSDNNKQTYREMLGEVRTHRWDVWSFGLVVAAGMMVPLLNLLVMPAAVAGATLMWIDWRKP